MAGATQQGDKLNVFISYSRDDIAFADQLRAALLGFDFAVTIDRENITSGEDWQKRLGLLIRDADTIVFVLSPSSTRSSTCAWEAKEAVGLGKRILPVLCRSLEDASLPPELAALQYTWFYDEPKLPGTGFGTGLNSLRLALNTDLDWLREHTRYLRLAKEWEDVGEPSDRRLLSAPDIALAKAWAARRPAKAPELTALQLDFIGASEAENRRQQSAEAQRLLEVAEAERQAKEAAEARATAETALRTTAETSARKLRALLIVAAIAFACAAIFAVGSGYEFLQATQQAEEARRQTDEARRQAARGDQESKRASEQLQRANHALAESINNDLGPEPDKPLTPRQRHALWKLATADELVKSQFITILAHSPEETIRDSPVFTQISRALGLLRPSAAESEVLVVTVDSALLTADKTREVAALVKVFKALSSRISGAEVDQVFESLLKQIDQTTNPFALQALTEAIGTLPAKLTEAQAQRAVEAVVKQIGQTTDPEALQALAKALQALPTKLTEAQAQQAVAPVLKQIGQTTDPEALQALARALQALAAKLTDAQVGQVLESLLKQIGQTADPEALLALAKALQMLPTRLTDAQAQQAVEPVLRQISQATDPKALQALAKALQALASKLSEAQAQGAVEPVLTQIRQTNDPEVRLAMATALDALPITLTEAQSNKTRETLLKQIGQTTDMEMFQRQASALQAVAKALQERGPKPTADDTMMQMIQQMEASIQAAAANNDAQATQTQMMLMMLLMQKGQTANPDETLADAKANQVIETLQANEAVEHALKQIGQATDPFVLQTLAETLRALPTKLTETQAQQAAEPVIKQIRQTADPEALRALAKALEAVAATLSDAQIGKATSVVSASLAWASNANEAAQWARTLVALTDPLSHHDKMLVAAVAYPTTAGPATEILLDAIRAAHPDAPLKENGTEAALKWLAKTYPEGLHPVCPQPLQAGLECPPPEAAAAEQ